MATLNVKNFPEDLYQALQARARQGHRSVAQEVIHLLDLAVSQPEPLSYSDLKRALERGDLGESVAEPQVAWGVPAADAPHRAPEGALAREVIRGERLRRLRLDELPRRDAIACTPDELVATSWESEWSPGL